MSYNLLLELYHGKATNADLVDRSQRNLLHVETPLDGLIQERVREGLDVVLSGNPGDGKSHLVRRLDDDGYLGHAVVELDLSAHADAAVVKRWVDARASGRPFVLCANQGPLTRLLPALESDPTLQEAGRELRAQLGQLTTPRAEALPPRPKQAMLIDLADRNLLEEGIIQKALGRICRSQFSPKLSPSIQRGTSAGRNLSLMQPAEAKRRLAQLLIIAGQRAGAHFTFRHLWSVLAFAITGGKAESTLQTEYYNKDRGVGLDTTPVGLLMRSRGRGAGQGPLFDALRRAADPAMAVDPQLDEELWTRGEPASGRWFAEELWRDELHVEPPARRWESGDYAGALEELKQLKRLVAIGHEQGERLIKQLRVGSTIPTSLPDAALLGAAFEGIKRLYLTEAAAAAQRSAGRSWLADELPLWVGHTYEDKPGHERPHVAVSSLDPSQLELLRPQRAPWLREGLGEPLELAWLAHRASGITLRLDPALLGCFEAARASEGPLPIPERVQRFLIQLSGWEETRAPDPLQLRERFAILNAPRGEVVTSRAVHHTQAKASYER